MKRKTVVVICIVCVVLLARYSGSRINLPRPCQHHWVVGTYGWKYYVSDCTGKAEGMVYQQFDGNWKANADHAFIFSKEFGSKEHDKAIAWVEAKEDSYWWSW